ncbi:MAG: hypothetical protein M3Y29_01560, partial [Chloroflexota bacterium]|nr:hypothetical protein [Chloroflexota bacterium]
ALGITTQPADRAPLLDRAARSAGAAASSDAVRYATEAIEAYRSVGDRVGAAAATARLGRVLIDESEIRRATDVLEAAVPEAEASGDEAALAETLAHLARAHMRAANTARAVEVADRALAIAERLNLESIVAEALTNKASALNMDGRRRESEALLSAALKIAQQIGEIALEIRIRNNLVAAIITDDPHRGLAMYLETRALAAEVGDRGMYNWVAGLTAIQTLFVAGDIDEQIATLNEAFDATTLSTDRLRLRMIRGVLETARGVHLQELRDDIAALVGDSSDPEHRFHLHMARGATAMVSGDEDTAFREAMAALDLQPQTPEVPLGMALRSAIWARDVDRVREVTTRIRALPSSGVLDRNFVLGAEAALAALEGRTADALAAFGEARATELRLGQHYEAALVVVNAAQLLGDLPEVRAWAEEARAVLTALGARPWLDELDAAVAPAPEAAAGGTGAAALIAAPGE